MKLLAKGPHGELSHLSFDGTPSTVDVKNRIAELIGIDSEKVKLWYDGTEVRGDGLPTEGESPVHTIGYTCTDDVFFMRINFVSIDDPSIPAKVFFFDLRTKADIFRKWIATEVECSPSDVKVFLDDEEIHDDQEAKTFEFKTLRYQVHITGVKFVDKQQRPNQTVTVNASTYKTLADYATHIASVSEINPDCISFSRNGKPLDKAEKMEDLMQDDNPINIYEMVTLAFPDQRTVKIRIDWTATIQEVTSKVQRYFAMVVVDLRSESNEVYPKTSLLRNVKKGYLSVTPENTQGNLFRFGRGKKRFSLWITEKEYVDSVLNRILTIPWFMKLERWDIEIENTGKGIVMSSHAQFKDVACLYRVKNKIATVSVTLPNGKVDVDIASSARCAEVKKALIKFVDPTLKESEVSLFSSHGKISKATKMRNCLTDERYYFVTERRKVNVEIETPDGKRSSMDVPPRLHVFELKERIKEEGIFTEEITDVKYQGHILSDDNSIYAIVYGKEKGVFAVD